MSKKLGLRCPVLCWQWLLVLHLLLTIWTAVN